MRMDTGSTPRGGQRIMLVEVEENKHATLCLIRLLTEMASQNSQCRRPVIIPRLHLFGFCLTFKTCSHISHKRVQRGDSL